MEKIKNVFNNVKTQIVANKNAVAMASVMALSSPIAFAGNANAIISSLLGYVFGIFFYIGVVLLAWGIGQLVLAFKNEDGDSKSRAIMLIVAAIVLMAVATIFNGLGLGVTGTLNTSF